jgi:Uma2 family endonuclease
MKEFPMPSATLLEPAPAVAPPLSSDEVFYEIIDGQIVEMPPETVYAAIVRSLLVSHLNHFARTNGLGVAVSMMLFRLDLPMDRKRWPKNQPLPETDDAWNVVPDLAIEVVSPNDFAQDLLEKVEEYFQAGVQLVWVGYPCRRRIHVYESFTQIRGLTRTDELDGGKVLPDFRLPLAELFPEPSTSA